MKKKMEWWEGWDEGMETGEEKEDRESKWAEE